MAAFVAALALVTPSCHGLTDNILCMPLPPRWHSSVEFDGMVTAAWMQAGNFRFRKYAKASPSVPPHKVLITIGDFPILGNWGKGWRRVQRLRLPNKRPSPPPHLPGKRSSPERLISWHVRFAHRALFLSAGFGSRPDAAARSLVNRRLASVRRIG